MKDDMRFTLLDGLSDKSQGEAAFERALNQAEKEIKQYLKKINQPM